MRCFEFNHSFVEGLPVSHLDDGRPCVILSGQAGLQRNKSGCAILAEPLATKFGSFNDEFAHPRLMRCDYEKTSELWLTQEKERSLDALILIPVHRKSTDSPAALSIEPTLYASVIADAPFEQLFHTYPQGNEVQRTGSAFLVHLKPHGYCKIFHRRTRTLFKSKPQLLALIGMRSDGSLFIDYHSERFELVCNASLGRSAARFLPGKP